VLDELSRNFINRWQGGVPLCSRPYARMAEAMGGGLTLAALSVPEARFDEVTRRVNAHPEVAHNYRREHELNMWFVVATETPGQVSRVLEAIGAETGLKVYDCPKQREFFIGLQLHVDENGHVDTVPLDAAVRGEGATAPQRAMPDAVDRRLIAATQAGLPLRLDPFAQLAQDCHLDEAEVLQRFGDLIAAGIIRRIGAAPNHYKLGLRGNGMTVWNIPDDEVDRIGSLLGGQDFVSHCYQRPRHQPQWPYNLFAMLHGEDRDAVLRKLARLESRLPRSYPHEVLFSSAILKKTGLRLAA